MVTKSFVRSDNNFWAGVFYGQMATESMRILLHLTGSWYVTLSSWLIEAVIKWMCCLLAYDCQAAAAAAAALNRPILPLTSTTSLTDLHSPVLPNLSTAAVTPTQNPLSMTFFPSAQAIQPAVSSGKPTMPALSTHWRSQGIARSDCHTTSVVTVEIHTHYMHIQRFFMPKNVLTCTVLVECTALAWTPIAHQEPRPPLLLSNFGLSFWSFWVFIQLSSPTAGNAYVSTSSRSVRTSG